MCYSGYFLGYRETFLCFWLPSILVIFPKQLESFTARLKVPFQPLLLMVFSFLVPCGTAPLFMNVCFILSDSSLHDWVLEAHLSFVAVFYLIWAVLCVPEVPRLWQSLGFQPNSPYWTSFGLLILADCAFPLLHGF